MFFEQIINGLTIGSIYALVAIGYTLVFGVLELVNFANGSVYLLGGYLALMTYLAWGRYFWLCLLLSIVCCGMVGLGLDFFALKRLRAKKAPKLAGLITTMGVSTVIDNVILLFFGSETKAYPNMITIPSLHIGDVSISGNQLVILGVAVLLMVLLSIMTYKTKLGKAMRCTSQNMNAAKLMGINTQAIISLTFVISSALAARCRRSGWYVLSDHRYQQRLCCGYENNGICCSRRRRRSARRDAWRLDYWCCRNAGSKLFECRVSECICLYHFDCDHFDQAVRNPGQREGH